MSSNYNHKAIHAESIIDKENAFFSSNLSHEKKYSAARQYRRQNELNLKSSLIHNGQESLTFQTANVPHNLPHIPSKVQREAELIRKTNANKVKKSLDFERNSLNGRPGDFANLQKEKSSYADKENRTYLAERNDRYSFGEARKQNLPVVEAKKAPGVVEPIRRSYAEKEQIKLNPVFEPIAKNDRHEADIAPEDSVSAFLEQESKKAILEVVDNKEICNKIVAEYADEIMETLKIKDKESTPVYPLDNHKIPSNLRAKMIDWMVEVLGSYKCSDQTFFIAVSLMDLYFQKAQAVHEVSDLHLIGVTCMFMASKYEEIYPLRLSVVHEKIAHKKLSVEQIKKKEMEIFATLEYKMTNVTPYEFIMNALFQLNLKETMTTKLYDYLQKVCIYLAKANMHDYELVSQQDYSELAASTLFVAFKIIEQLDKTFPLNHMLKKLREILNVEEDIVYDCATRILSVAKNFDKLYPNLENLKKFHSFNFDNVMTPSQSSGRGRTSQNQ